MKLEIDSAGVYHVQFATQHGTTGDVKLNTKSEAEAKTLVTKMRVQDLESVSSVVDLTHQVVTQIVAGKEITVANAVQIWCEHVTSTRILAPTTIHANHGFLNVWMKEMSVENKPLTSVTSRDISDYVNAGSEKRSTAVRKIAAIRSFFSFCQDQGLTYRNPASRSLVKVTYNVFKHEEKETKVREVFNEKEMERLLEEANSFWRCAVTIARETGLRLGDIAQLEWASFRDGRLVVWTDKANKRVDVPVSGQISGVLGRLSETDITYCFPRQREISLDPKRRPLLSVQFSRLCKKAGIEGRSFHCLRHTNASALVQAGSSLDEVAKRLGHSSTKTTQGYVHG